MPRKLDAETQAEGVVDALGLLYHNDLDPDDFMLFPAESGATIETDGEAAYWETDYGSREGFECLVRTILSQNTSDAASQPAHDGLVDRYGPDLVVSLAAADHGELAETIQSAGLYNQKAETLIGAARWVREEFGSAEAFDSYILEGEPGEVRETLLSIDGVGPKTADCVLLFAGERPGVFPVDTHVHRIARRPACLDDPEACPLADFCAQVGIDPLAGEVTDPGEAVADD